MNIKIKVTFGDQLVYIYQLTMFDKVMILFHWHCFTKWYLGIFIRELIIAYTDVHAISPTHVSGHRHTDLILAVDPPMAHELVPALLKHGPGASGENYLRQSPTADREFVEVQRVSVEERSSSIPLEQKGRSLDAVERVSRQCDSTEMETVNHTKGRGRSKRIEVLYIIEVVIRINNSVI